MTKLQAILLLNIFIGAVKLHDNIQVRTQQGIVKGARDVTANNRPFYSFTGIPFAKPPVGPLRFEPPLQADPWIGVFDATKEPPMCVQFVPTEDPNQILGSEDCLHLNVFTPQLPRHNEKLLPVMFYIYGGGFVLGVAQKAQWGPKLLLTKDVVLVTCNYRMGSLGFMSTGDKTVPGNTGLKDQAFALQWVKNNIRNFGGDPERITAFGHSAGGISAHLHTLSPLTKSMVKGVIAQSGLAITPDGLLSLKIVSNATKTVARSLGCNQQNTKAMITCLKEVPIVNFVKATRNVLEEKSDANHAFRPVIEPDCNEPYLAKDPIEIIQCGEAADVSILTGTTSEDGAVMGGLVLVTPTLLDNYNQNFDELVSNLLFLSDSLSVQDQRRFTSAVRKFYLKDKLIGNDTKTEFINMCTDAEFLYPAQKYTELHAQYLKRSVYNYIFDYKGSKTFGEFYYGPGYDFGVVHGDELVYLFDSPDLFPNYTFTATEKRMSEVLVTLWTNFAYYGNPTPTDNSWKSFTNSQRNYYIIKGPNHRHIEKDVHKHRIDFWKNLWQSI